MILAFGRVVAVDPVEWGYFKYQPSFEVQGPGSEFGRKANPQHWCLGMKGGRNKEEIAS